MPNRLSKILSRSSKEKEAEAEAQRNNSDSQSASPPPEYRQQADEVQDYDRDNVLQPPDISAGFANLTIDPKSATSKTPTPEQCIAHLKLLECFYRLRQKVGSTDGLFGLNDSIVLDKGLAASDSTPEVLAKLSEKRWAIYVSRAVDRFATWADMLLPNNEMIKRERLEREGNNGTLCDPNSKTPPLDFKREYMPPVDVLMVWHAYMLNPRAYLEDCLRLGRMRMWHTVFPWQVVADCIDSEIFVYQDSRAATYFQELTGLPWDQLDDHSLKHLSCPACRNELEVRYTTCHQMAASMPKNYNTWPHLSKDLDDVLSDGVGYCDRMFLTQCPKCESAIDHDWLRAAKFCADLRLLKNSDVPMPGTILGVKGVPARYGPVHDYMYKDTNRFPNKFLSGWLGQNILDELSTPENAVPHSMDAVRDKIEQGLKNGSHMRSARSSLSSTPQRPEKISIRRVMQRYWDNSSPFALDLVGAVIRQGSFIEKMHNIDWLHSPALPSTMKRLVTKYLRFVNIMKDKYNMACPTLDVDLAWHTHQCSPPNYMDYTCHITKQFIDHDDKVAETKLNDSFAWTSKKYQSLYGEPYSECTCWYCEAIRESHTSGLSRMMGGGNARAEDALHAVEQDPSKSVHISAHNAVRPDDPVYQLTADKKAKELEREYQKACERAKRKGRKPPKRDDYYYSDAWGK